MKSNEQQAKAILMTANHFETNRPPDERLTMMIVRRVCTVLICLTGISYHCLGEAFSTANDQLQSTQSDTEKSVEQRKLLQELRYALIALDGSDAPRATHATQFQATYAYAGREPIKATFKQLVDGKGQLQSSRSAVATSSTPAQIKSDADKSRRPIASPSSWEEGYLLNPSAALTYLLNATDLTVKSLSMPDPSTGKTRVGILIQEASGSGPTPRQVWFLSPDTHLPEATAYFLPSLTGAPPSIGSMVVYQKYADVNGRKFPGNISHRNRNGQTTSIEIREVSEETVSK